jgi:hypothetical protein
MKKLTAIILFIAAGLMSLSPINPRSGVKAHVESKISPATQSIDIVPDDIAASGELAITKEWMLSEYGAQIGTTGLILQDLSGDGTMEIVVGTSSSIWYVLRQSGPNTYSQIWISDKYPTPIYQIAAADVDNDGVAEIFVGQATSISIYRGTDFCQIASFPISFTTQSMEIADTNGDGSKEIIISNEIKVAAYHPLNFQQLWIINEFGGDFSVGNVDNDATPEIIMASGYVLNGATRVEKWHYTGKGGFGVQVELGDVNGDGIAEIVGRSSQRIAIFDAVLRSSQWEITTTHTFQALTLVDVNGDIHMDFEFRQKVVR